ncbi:MAG: DUF5018 domain-containing protein [Proteiniphilum sp.]|nr:DUF5018 domain-containing protein [Proteiniphilum sp.]
MKIINSINYILIICLLGLLGSCKNELADNLIPENAYILQSGDVEVAVFRNNSIFEYDITINKSGIKNSNSTFELITGHSVLEEYNEKYNTNYKLISEENFDIETTSFNLSSDERKSTIKIIVDVNKIKEFIPTNTVDYAIPVKLVSKSEDIEVTNDKQYAIILPRLTGGIRDNSETLLWEKTLDQMDIDQMDNNTVSMAITEKYLFVNTRNSDLKYFDRFTGEYIGTIELPFKGSLNNFSMASDRNNSLIISSLRRGAATTQQDLYRIDGTNKPTLFASVTHNISNGRKLSILGDLSGESIICSVLENEPSFAYWRTKNGEVVSNNPEIFSANPLELGWTLQADVYPLSLDISEGVYMTGFGNNTLSKFAFVDGVSKSVAYEYDLIGGGIDKSLKWATHSIDIITYNDAKYLALGSVNSNSINARLLHIEDPSHISKSPLSGDLCKFITQFETDSNAQSTGEVLLSTSDNGKYLQMYILATNGGVKVYQFDSKGDLTE